MHETLSEFLACVRRKFDFGHILQESFFCCPLFCVFLGDLNERAHEKTTTDILEQQLFVYKIIRLSISYISDVRFIKMIATHRLI